MTNKQRVLRIIGVIMVLLFASCQNEDDLKPPSSVEKGPIIKVFRDAEAKSRNVATNKLLQRQGLSTNGKLKISTEGDGNRGMDEIEINYAKVMETDDSFGNKHLTYEGIKENAPETTFYNIVITEKEGKSKIVLVKYEMEPSFLDEYQLSGKIENFRGTVTFTEVFSDSDFPCNQNPSIPIPVNPGDGSGPGGGGGSGGGGADANPPPSGSNPGYSQGLVDAQFLALSFQAAVAWGNSEDGYYEVSSSPRYQRIAPIIVDPSNPCGGGLEIGIMEPVLPQDSCKKLKQMSDNTNNKAAIQNLQTKTSENKEFGYYVVKNNNGNYSTPHPCDAMANNPAKILMPVGGNNIGAFHTHPLASTNDTFPMFSDGDLNYLFWIAQKHNTNGQQKDYSEYFLTLTVPEGTFAIKIKDFTKFAAFRNNSYIWQNESGGTNGKLEELRKLYRRITPAGNTNKMKNALLEVFRDYNAGIGLYQVSSDLNSWEELELAPNASYRNNIEPIKKPCN